jgi:hypothetical protein
VSRVLTKMTAALARPSRTNGFMLMVEFERSRGPPQVSATLPHLSSREQLTTAAIKFNEVDFELN